MKVAVAPIINSETNALDVVGAGTEESVAAAEIQELDYVDLTARAMLPPHLTFIALPVLVTLSLAPLSQNVATASTQTIVILVEPLIASHSASLLKKLIP